MTTTLTLTATPLAEEEEEFVVAAVVDEIIIILQTVEKEAEEDVAAPDIEIMKPLQELQEGIIMVM
jgi:hypothetical protein